MRAAAGGQREHGFLFQRSLRQQIEQHLEQPAVGGLVDRRGHNDSPRSGDLLNRLDDGRVAPFSQQQRLGRQLTDVEAIHHQAAPQGQPVADRIQQRG